MSKYLKTHLVELDTQIAKHLLTNPDMRPGAQEAIRRWRLRTTTGSAVHVPYAKSSSGGMPPQKVSLKNC